MKKYTNLKVEFTEEELETLKNARSILSEISEGLYSGDEIYKEDVLVCDLDEIEDALDVLSNLIS